MWHRHKFFKGQFYTDSCFLSFSIVCTLRHCSWLSREKPCTISCEKNKNTVHTPIVMFLPWLSYLCKTLWELRMLLVCTCLQKKASSEKKGWLPWVLNVQEKPVLSACCTDWRETGYIWANAPTVECRGSWNVQSKSFNASVTCWVIAIMKFNILFGCLLSPKEILNNILLNTFNKTFLDV